LVPAYAVTSSVTATTVNSGLVHAIGMLLPDSLAHVSRPHVGDGRIIGGGFADRKEAAPGVHIPAHGAEERRLL
jgi:hypothetical protein